MYFHDCFAQGAENSGLTKWAVAIPLANEKRAVRCSKKRDILFKMKVIVSGILGILLTTLGFGAEIARVERVDPLEFKAFLDSGNGIVLDVRTPEEVAQGTIGDASVINFYSKDFQRKLAMMPKEKPIYLFCRSGGRSGQAAKMMTAMGFSKIVDLNGGIGAWKRAGLPLTASQIGVGSKGVKISGEILEKTLSGELPVLIAFQTKWCAPCRVMKPVLEDFERKSAGSVKLMLIDMDANGEIANRYQVKGVPTFLAFKSGDEFWRDSGVLSLEELKAGVGL